MARSVFRSISPSLLDPNIFQDAFEKASRAMEQDVKGAFIDATSGWKNPPQWRGYVRLTADNIYISVGTANEIFKFVDEGTVAHIIRPVKAKMLHWVDAGMTYWAISDVDPADLRMFADTYASAR